MKTGHSIDKVNNITIYDDGEFYIYENNQRVEFPTVDEAVEYIRDEYNSDGTHKEEPVENHRYIARLLNRSDNQVDEIVFAPNIEEAERKARAIAKKKRLRYLYIEKADIKGKDIDAATLVRYNANNRGKSVGDCAKRALSLAFGVSYTDMSRMLLEAQKATRSRAWNLRGSYSTVIYKLGGEQRKHIGDKDITLAEFADSHPTGGYLVETGKFKSNHSDHIVYVEDGKIYDSWDSLEEKAFGYYKIPSRYKKADTDISDNMRDLGEFIYETVDSLVIEKYMKKYPWLNDSEISGKVTKREFRLTYNIDVVTEDNKDYHFSLVFALSPKMTLEEAKKYIEDTAKIRLYDRLYEINKKEVERQIELETMPELPEGTALAQDKWLSPQEEKFLNTLPGSWRNKIVYIDIDNPGRYSDSYTVKIIKDPKDNINDPGEFPYKFIASTSSEMKQYLRDYFNNFELQQGYY